MALAKTKCAGGVILTKMRGEQRWTSKAERAKKIEKFN